MNNYLSNWYPVKLLRENDGHKCLWKNLEGISFIDPFFSETVTRACSIKINNAQYKPTSDLKILTEWTGSIDSVEPAMFIFHISRCGSTLLSQALSLSDEHIVLSEVPFIDELLQLLTIDEWLVNTEYQQILKAAISIYGQKKNKKQKSLFIKTDSWHIYYLHLFRVLYPSVSFLFLYREPKAVLNSQYIKRGMHAIPGLIADHVLGIETNLSEYIDFDKHLINVLISYLFSFVNLIQTDANSFLANYSEGIENITSNVFQIIGEEIDELYRANINERCRYNAKYPDQPFVNDSLLRQTTDSTELKFLYIELEELRMMK